jgi:hypothetical protein
MRKARWRIKMVKWIGEVKAAELAEDLDTDDA